MIPSNIPFLNPMDPFDILKLFPLVSVYWHEKRRDFFLFFDWNSALLIEDEQRKRPAIILHNDNYGIVNAVFF